MSRGRLSLWTLGQCPGYHHFWGPPLTCQATLERAETVMETAFAQVPEGLRPASGTLSSPLTVRKGEH